ncbi:MAG: DUF2442 domain-containing protein [Acidobacteria bacterium]|nr:DUF2442 domain-containing protein [Acidobacteriota bacterium]
MSSSIPGAGILPVEVGNIDRFGFWLLVGDREYFLPYEDFPWFREAKIAEILNVELAHENHLYWPALDVDLCIESLEAPEKFPLIFKGTANGQEAATSPGSKPAE